MGFKNKGNPSGFYGFVELSDGTELEIVERPETTERQVKKIRSKLKNMGTEFKVDLCLFDHGDYILPDDALDLPYLFREDAPEKGCLNFLKMMESEFRLNVIMSKTKFNQFMLNHIISNIPPNGLSSQLQTSMALRQDIFPFADFIKSLSILDKCLLFTENPCRTESNMSSYRSLIVETLKEILRHNLNDETMFNLKEINLFDTESDFKVRLEYMSKEFFSNQFPFKALAKSLKRELLADTYKMLKQADTLSYIEQCVKKNPTAENHETIEEYFRTEATRIRVAANKKQNALNILDTVF